MRPIWFFYIFLGMVFMFAVYMTTIGQMNWFHMIYYIVLGFVGIMALWSGQMRLSFLVGIALGVVVLVLLYKYQILTFDTRLRFLMEFM